LAIANRGNGQAGAIRARARRVIAVFIVGILIVASMYLYNYATTSSRFAVDRVELTGLSRVEAAEIEPLVADLAGQNLFLAPVEVVESRLEAHPRIARVSSRRVLPNRLTCDVVEREPVALLFTDRFFEIDGEGMVMPGDEFTPMLDLPTITGVSPRSVRAGRLCEDPRVRGALEALVVCRTLGGKFADEISEVRATAAGLSIRSLTDDCELLVGDTEFEKRLRKFFLLREALSDRSHATGLIDLRFENQVVLRGDI
jgi:cell division septal protein FtsQ